MGILVQYSLRKKAFLLNHRQCFLQHLLQSIPIQEDRIATPILLSLWELRGSLHHSRIGSGYFLSEFQNHHSENMSYQAHYLSTRLQSWIVCAEDSLRFSTDNLGLHPVKLYCYINSHGVTKPSFFKKGVCSCYHYLCLNNGPDILRHTYNIAFKKTK